MLLSTRAMHGYWHLNVKNRKIPNSFYGSDSSLKIKLESDQNQTESQF